MFLDGRYGIKPEEWVTINRLGNIETGRKITFSCYGKSTSATKPGKIPFRMVKFFNLVVIDQQSVSKSTRLYPSISG